MAQNNAISILERPISNMCNTNGQTNAQICFLYFSYRAPIEPIAFGPNLNTDRGNNAHGPCTIHDKWTWSAHNVRDTVWSIRKQSEVAVPRLTLAGKHQTEWTHHDCGPEGVRKETQRNWSNNYCKKPIFQKSCARGSENLFPLPVPIMGSANWQEKNRIWGLGGAAGPFVPTNCKTGKAKSF